MGKLGFVLSVVFVVGCWGSEDPVPVEAACRSAAQGWCEGFAECLDPENDVRVCAEQFAEGCEINNRHEAPVPLASVEACSDAWYDSACSDQPTTAVPECAWFYGVRSYGRSYSTSTP